MLRSIFGEPPRKDEGYLLEANQAIRKYLNILDLIPEGDQTAQERRFVIWSESFLRSIDELEQSEYAAIKYGLLVKKTYLDQMKSPEKDDYHRHLYYYKNAIIRMFAILDKLGHFLNERFNLQTERFKAHFSYFTVLRNMRQNGLYTELESRLYGIKTSYAEPVSRLRNQRNREIHTIDVDLFDDLINSSKAKYHRTQTEDIRQNLDDLEKGCDMTFRAVGIAFRYLVKRPLEQEVPGFRSSSPKKGYSRRKG